MFRTCCLLALISLGCDRAGPADYFPLSPGAQRVMKVYTHLVQGRDTSETTRVQLVEMVHGERDVPGLGRVWVVEAPRDSGRSTFSYFRKREDGVIQMMLNREREPVELLYLALPLSKGLKWYETREQREVMEVVGRDTVTIGDRHYPDCFEVRVSSTRADWTLRQWLAPGIGPVKWVNRSSWTGKDGVRRELLRQAELVSYQAPNSTDP